MCRCAVLWSRDAILRSPSTQRVRLGVSKIAQAGNTASPRDLTVAVYLRKDEPAGWDLSHVLHSVVGTSPFPHTRWGSYRIAHQKKRRPRIFPRPLQANILAAARNFCEVHRIGLRKKQGARINPRAPATWQPSARRARGHMSPAPSRFSRIASKMMPIRTLPIAWTAS
jgi:hypothetical protein